MAFSVSLLLLVMVFLLAGPSPFKSQPANVAKAQEMLERARKSGSYNEVNGYCNEVNFMIQTGYPHSELMKIHSELAEIHSRLCEEVR